jgi:hypothetical protein
MQLLFVCILHQSHGLVHLPQKVDIKIGRAGCTVVRWVQQKLSGSLPESHQKLKVCSKLVSESGSLVMVFGSPSRMWSWISGS